MREARSRGRRRAPLPSELPVSAATGTGLAFVLVQDIARHDGALRSDSAPLPATARVVSLQDAARIVRAGGARIVLIDSRLLEGDTLAQALEWATRHPDVPLAALAVAPSPFEARFVIEAGLKGYLPHDLPPARRDAALALIATGEMFVPACMMRAVIPDPSPLLRLPETLLFQRVMDQAGRITFPFLCEAARTILGVDPVQVRERPEILLATVHPEDAPMMRRLALRSAASLQSYSVEYRCVAPDGAVHWRRCHYRARRGAQGSTIWDGISVAISPEQPDKAPAPAAEPDLAPTALPADPPITRLPMAAADLEDFLDGLPACLHRTVFDPHGQPHVAIVSRGVEAMLEIAGEEALARASLLFEMVHPEDRERLVADIQATGEVERRSDLEYRMVLASGAVRWVRNVSRRRRLPSGEVVSDGIVTDITAQKELEARLRASEERIRALVANLPCILFRRVMDQDGPREYPFVAFGPRMEAFLGFSPEQAMAVPGRLFQALHEDVREEAARMMRESARTLVPYERTWRMVGACGETRWMRSAVHLTARPDGRVDADGVVIDVTEHKRLEERLETLIRNLPGVVFRRVFRRDGGSHYAHISFGEARARILGLNPQEALEDAERMLLRIHPDDQPAHRAALARHALSLEPFDRTFRIVTPKGDTSWFRMLAHFWREPDGDVIADGITIDVSREKEAEAQLAESEARLRALTANLPVAVFRWAVAPDGRERCLYISPGIEHMTGLDADQVMRDPGCIDGLLHPDDRAAADGAWQRAIHDLAPIEDEARMVLADGTIRWLRVIATLHRGEGGLVIADGVLLDVTERRRMAEQLARRNRELLALCRVSEIALRSPDIDHGLAGIVAEVARFMPGCDATVMLYDPQTEEMELRATTTLAGSGRVPLARTVSQEVLRTGRPVIVHGALARDEERFETLRLAGCDSLVGLPIRVGERCIGTFCLLSRDRLEVQPELMEHLWSYADYVSSFIASRNIHRPPPDDPATRRREAFEAQFAGILTRRQRDVLDEIALGRSNREIADDLTIGLTTVKVHVRAILKSLGLRNRTEAARFVLQQGEPSADAPRPRGGGKKVRR